MAKARIVHVPYKGGGPAMTDLLGGQILASFASAPSALPHVKAGKIRALATTGAARVRVPAGRTDYRRVGLSGLRGDELVRVHRAGQDTEGCGRAAQPRAGERSRHPGGPRAAPRTAAWSREPSTPEELAKYIDRELAVWGRVVKEAGIKAE